jgi:hypothetical protein
LERTIFYIKDKYVFNKLWSKDNSLPKWLIKKAHTVTVPGYSILSRYTVFVDKNIQLKSKIIYHKIDIEKEIVLIENNLKFINGELGKIEVDLWNKFNYSLNLNN